MNLLKKTLRQVRRSPYQAAAAVSVMTLTFFIASIFIVLTMGSEVILRYFETRPQITAFFTDEIDKATVVDLEKTLWQTGKVTSIKYISKEEALAIYREQNQSEPLLLEMVTSKMLPASLEVSAINAPALKDLAETIKIQNGIESVAFQKDIVEKLSSFIQVLRFGGLTLLGILLFNSLVIILMVILFKIIAKREEINTLQLIGASRWYIRFPFILEGIIYGFLGSVFSTVLSLFLLSYLTPLISNSVFFQKSLTEIPIFPIPPLFFAELAGANLLFGVIIGSLGAFIAVWRYLK